MLPFFRRIRKELADDNQALKYSRYAIGEIVLVVIGILIALQINNWNEERKDRKLELQLLKSFERSLEKDLSDMDSNIQTHQNGIRAANTILKIFEEPGPRNIDSVSVLMSKVVMPTLFVYSTSAFETLKSKGVTLISNDSLRDQIIEVYDSRYRFFINNEKIHYDNLENMLAEVFPGRFEDSYNYKINPPKFDGSMRPLDVDALADDSVFRYHLKSFRNRLVILVDWQYAELRRRIVDLREEILDEIKAFESK